MASGQQLLVRARRGAEHRGHDLTSLEPLTGDVSPRCYARVRLGPDERSAILAAYPEDARDAHRRFLATTALLLKAAVRVPAIIDHDLAAGWTLVEDLGPRTLFDMGGDWDRLEPYFLAAVGVIAGLQRIPPRPVSALNPPLDQALLRRELSETWDAFLEPRGLIGDAAQAAALGRGLDTLCQTLAAESPKVCHRDLMARNLVPCGGGVAVLDHQDLRLGPPGYDLASLLNDSLFPPPPVAARLLAAAALSPAGRLGYRRAAAQRALKAVGTFTRLGTDLHRALIPTTLARAFGHLRTLPETAAAMPPLRARWQQVAGSDLLD